MTRVIRSPESRKDLRAIGRYIAIRSGSRSVADQFLDTIKEKCQLYATQRYAAQSFDRYDIPELRGFPVNDYIVFYVPIDDGIQLYRVLHGAQELDKLL